MRKYLSIKQHLYLMLVILLVPPTILLAYSISERHRNETSSIYAKSLTLARTSVDNASSLLNEAHYILDGMIARPLIRALDPSRCDPILHDLRSWYREFANLSVIDRSGQVICNSTSEVAQKLPNYSIRKWFRSATESKSFTIGEPIIGGTTNLWIVPLVQPMVDENANLMGFLSLTVNMARFKPSFVREEFPAGTEVSIIDSSGAYVARSVDTEAKNWLGQQSPIAHLLKMVLDTQGNAATSVRYQSEGGSEIVASFMGVQRSNWHVIAEIPMGAITTRARDVTIFNMAIVFLVLAAAIGAATFVIRKIERPISSIVATAVKQMRGDRTARAAELGPTEIITVARQFNLMLDARDQAERDRVGANERITYMAHHDLLTGLANRTLFLEGIDDARVRLRSRGEPFTVFMLDLDGFKDINDSFGHPAGDTLLREAGQRIKSVLCETDILARLGGDEFALLRSGGTSDPDDSSTLAIKIMDILACPFDIDGSKVVINTSIGIAQAPADGVEPDDLIKKADLALYRRKSDGRNGYCFFESRMTADADARMQLGQDLRDAILNGELAVHYQPIIDISTRKPCGAEALVRWRHSRRGDIPCDKFIPLAEESGLIIPLGEFVLQRACADAVNWPSETKVAVNLSSAQFRSANLLDVILHTLAESGLAPDRLELEITESLMIETQFDILPVFHQLKKLGISIALDDFGTGYSSLSYLTMFPFDRIKIDKSFTQSIIMRTECAAIVSSVLMLGRELGLRVTAEGVETEEQFELLRARGTHAVQGYLFGRPCPVSELDLVSPRFIQSTASAA